MAGSVPGRPTDVPFKALCMVECVPCFGRVVFAFVECITSAQLRKRATYYYVDPPPSIPSMKLKAKIFLLAIVPFLIAIAGIEIGVRQQATSLAKAQHDTTQSAYLASKEIEL